MEPSFDATVFTKNRRRLLRHKVGRTLFEEVAYEADRRGLMSDEHFSVDGTLIEAAASIKSFRRRDDDDDTDNCGNGVSQTEDFRGEKLSNETHQSTTDPEARLMRKGKGKEAKLMFMAHALMDNRHGLVSDFRLTEANGMAERDAALDMLIQIPGSRRLTVGADRGYDSRDFVAECRGLNITPHVAQKKRWSAIDGRTTCHESYRASQKVRKRVESIFGWMKDCGRVPSESVSWSRENRTVWRVGGYGVQPGEDVEADSRAGGQSPCRRLDCRSRGVSVGPG